MQKYISASRCQVALTFSTPSRLRYRTTCSRTRGHWCAISSVVREDDAVVVRIERGDDSELVVTIRTFAPGDVVTLGYVRNGREGEAKVTLGKDKG